MKPKATRSKSGSIMFARGVVYLAGIAALAVCFILLPELVREESVEKPIEPIVTYAFFAGVYILTIPFFVALYQTHKLLRYIEKNKAFTNESIKALKNIKFCAILFSFLVVLELTAGIIFTRNVDPREDITAFITIGFICTFVSGVIAVFVAVLQKLLAEAVAMKSENDLII